MIFVAESWKALERLEYWSTKWHELFSLWEKGVPLAEVKRKKRKLGIHKHRTAR
jgi:hypothetical protein